MNIHPWTKTKLEIFINISNILAVAKQNDVITKDILVLQNLEISNCEQGEVFNNIIGSCIICPKGTYSFDFNDKECKICPLQAIDCTKNIINLKPKYWMSPKTTIIYPCFPNAQSCL